MSGHGIIRVYYLVKFVEHLEAVDLCILPHSGSSQSLFLPIIRPPTNLFFFTQHPFLSPSGTLMAWMFEFFCTVSQVSEVTHRFILSDLFPPSLLLKLHNFYSYIVTLTDSFLCHLHSAIKPLQRVLFVWNFPFGPSFYLLFLCWDFLSVRGNNMHPYLKEEFYNSYFRASTRQSHHLCRLCVSICSLSLGSWDFPGSLCSKWLWTVY